MLKGYRYCIMWSESFVLVMLFKFAIMQFCAIPILQKMLYTEEEKTCGCSPLNLLKNTTLNGIFQRNLD